MKPKRKNVNTFNDDEDDTSPVRDASGVNGSGSGSKSDAPLTQPCSADVHALTAMRADLLDMQKRHGADSAVGHHCENLRQMFLVYSAAYGDEAKRAKLEKSIRRQWADLIGLTGGMQ